MSKTSHFGLDNCGFTPTHGSTHSGAKSWYPRFVLLGPWLCVVPIHWVSNDNSLSCSPSRYTCGKWRFRLGFLILKMSCHPGGDYDWEGRQPKEFMILILGNGFMFVHVFNHENWGKDLIWQACVWLNLSTSIAFVATWHLFPRWLAGFVSILPD